MPLSGMLPVLPTPYSADGAVDLRAMERIVDFASSAKADGLVFPGFASEVSELTATERNSLLGVIARRAPQGLPLIAGASAPDALEVIGHAKMARTLGIDHLMIQPPVAIGGEFDSVMRFLAPIAEALPDMKIILQNAPAPRGSDLSPATISRIVTEISQIAYIKEETLPAGPAITYLLENRPKSLLGVIGGGGARYILDEYARGACAAMPAVEIIDLHVALDRAWRAGRKAEARDIYVRTLPLLTLQTVYRTRLTKHVLMRRNVLKNADVRASGPMLDQVALDDIDANLTELGLYGRPADAKADVA